MVVGRPKGARAYSLPQEPITLPVCLLGQGLVLCAGALHSLQHAAGCWHGGAALEPPLLPHITQRTATQKLAVAN